MHLLRFKMQWSHCTVRHDLTEPEVLHTKEANIQRQEKLKDREGSRNFFSCLKIMICICFPFSVFMKILSRFCPLYGKSVEYFGVLLSQVEENCMHVSKLSLPFLLGQMALLLRTEKWIACTTLKKENYGINLEVS